MGIFPSAFSSSRPFRYARASDDRLYVAIDGEVEGPWVRTKKRVFETNMVGAREYNLSLGRTRFFPDIFPSFLLSIHLSETHRLPTLLHLIRSDPSLSTILFTQNRYFFGPAPIRSYKRAPTILQIAHLTSAENISKSD